MHYSSCIDTQLTEHQLDKGVSFIHCCIMTTLYKSSVQICVGPLLGSLYFVSLVYFCLLQFGLLSNFVPILHNLNSCDFVSINNQ